MAVLCGVLAVENACAQHVEPLAFADFEHWVTREIKESALLGGKTKTVYAIAPTRHIQGNKAYKNMGGSPWASSNVMANVMGVVKASNGSIFLGEVNEPIRSTNSPYSKMEMGIPFTKRPTRLIFDYKYKASPDNFRTQSTGFSARKQLPGRDNGEVYILLQHRWEDADGNVYAHRVGTGRERYGKSTAGWVNGHSIPIHYGDITDKPFYKSYMGLIPEENSYYCRNSKGEIVPVRENGWASPDEQPTHIIIWLSSSCGEAFYGGLGNTFWVDNFELLY